jgi:hypothetical protein
MQPVPPIPAARPLFAGGLGAIGSAAAENGVSPLVRFPLDAPAHTAAAKASFISCGSEGDVGSKIEGGSNADKSALRARLNHMSVRGPRRRTLSLRSTCVRKRHARHLSASGIASKVRPQGDVSHTKEKPRRSGA